MTDNKKLERINHKIKSRLELHGNIKTYSKNIKVVRQNMNHFRNKVPMLRRHGIRNDLKNNTMNALSKSEDYTAQGIVIASKGIGMAKATVRTGVSAIKIPYRVGKTAYRITKFTIRTGKRLAGKKYALDPQLKETLFSRLRKNNRLRKKKPGLISEAKCAGNNLLQIHKEDTTNTGVASIQQALESRRQLRPVANIAKKTVKTTYNITVKKPVVAIARRNQYNALQSLRAKQRELRYGKNSINTSSQLGKIKTLKDRRRVKFARRNLAQKNFGKKGIKATSKAATKATKSLLKIMTNPLVMKFVALVGIIVILVSIITSVLSAFFPAAGTVAIDEKTILKYSERIEELNNSFKNDIDKLLNDSRYDEHVLYYSGEAGNMEISLVEILAIVAVKFEQNLKFSSREKSTIDELFKLMLFYETETESYYCSGCVPVVIPSTESDSESDSNQSATVVWTCPGHKRLKIYVYSRDMEEVMTKIGFDEDQKEWARIMATSDLAAMFPDVPGLSQETRNRDEIKVLIDNAPTTDVTRETVVQTAKSLEGKVGYFWGGKSAAGWNSNWGKSTLVTAEGSSTSGTYQPYGLDCSGFVDWVYKTAGVGNMLAAGGTTYQWNQSYSISEGELLPGDLAFKSTPNMSGINHVGIFIGRDENGKKQYIHCASGKGVVIDNYSGFKFFRRVFVKFPR